MWGFGVPGTEKYPNFDFEFQLQPLVILCLMSLE